MLFKKVDLENRVQDIRIRGKRIMDIALDLIVEEERKSYMPWRRTPARTSPSIFT